MKQRSCFLGIGMVTAVALLFGMSAPVRAQWQVLSQNVLENVAQVFQGVPQTVPSPNSSTGTTQFNAQPNAQPDAQPDTQLNAQPDAQPDTQLKLQLTLAKQMITPDESGQPVTTWQSLDQNAVVQPGDVLRYSVSGHNQSDRPLENVVITQPVPAEMQYVLNSAAVDAALPTTITYSIDGGQSFVTNPTIAVPQPDGSIKVEPAPARAYTHVRWSFPAALQTAALINVTYQTEVR